MIIRDEDAIKEDARRRVSAEVVAEAEPVPALLTVQQGVTFAVYTAEVSSIMDAATSAPLETAEQYARLSELLARGKAAAKGLDGVRKAAVGPLNDQVKEINGIFRPLSDALGAFEARAKRLILAWRQLEAAERRRQQEEARRKQEEAAVREAEAMAKAQAAKTAKARERALIAAQAASKAQMAAAVSEPVGPAPRGIRTDSGSSSTTTYWTFKVMKPELVPREWLLIDKKAIGAAVRRKDGVREIPGVAIYEEESLAVRAG